jgi:hypothetical protein
MKLLRFNIQFFSATFPPLSLSSPKLSLRPGLPRGDRCPTDQTGPLGLGNPSAVPRSPKTQRGSRAGRTAGQIAEQSNADRSRARFREWVRRAVLRRTGAALLRISPDRSGRRGRSAAIFSRELGESPVRPSAIPNGPPILAVSE